MGIFKGIFGNKNSVNYDKAFEKSPDDVFQGDLKGISLLLRGE